MVFSYNVTRELFLSARFSVPPAIGLDWINREGNSEVTGILGVKKIWNRRRGKTKSRLMFLNCHGRAAMERTLTSDTWDLLHKNGFLFLSETMMQERKFHDLFSNKTAFVVHAKKHSKGRPFGGLQMIVNKSLKPQLLSKDDNHICVTACGLTVCGLYFNPESELDDICKIVSQVVNRCPDKKNLILAGDLNLKPHTEDFEEFCELLLEDEIILRSDPSTPTFFHQKGSSTLDHVFASARMDVVSTGVFDKGISDHAAITAIAHIKRSPCSTFMKTREIYKTWFDVENATKDLH